MLEVRQHISLEGGIFGGGGSGGSGGGDGQNNTSRQGKDRNDNNKKVRITATSIAVRSSNRHKTNKLGIEP